MLAADDAWACNPPAPIQCSRVTVLVKGSAGPMIIAAAGGTVSIPITVAIGATAGATPPCAAPISTTVTLTAMCTPGPGAGPVMFTFPTPTTAIYIVAPMMLAFPPGPVRMCMITGTAVTTWTDGSTTTGMGDVAICLVEPSPSNPSIPRLNMELISAPAVQAHPGDQRTHTVRLTNNDPINSVTGTITFSANQNGRLSTMTPAPPPGSGDRPGSFGRAFSGDALPIDDGSPLRSPCLVLPLDPTAASVISFTKTVTLAPGEVRLVDVRQRSFPKCRSGSCSETLMHFSGTFSDSTPALACVQSTFMVNSMVPPDHVCEDAGTTAIASPNGPGALFQASLPGFPVNESVVPSSFFNSPGTTFQPTTQQSVITDQGLGNNIARMTQSFQLLPPINIGQPVNGTVNVNINSVIGGITSTVTAAEIIPAEPGLGDTYFYIDAHTRLSGPSIPPMLNSFFDVFFSVSLDGITSTGQHIPLQIIQPSVANALMPPSGLQLNFAGTFPSTPGVAPPIIRVDAHVDAITQVTGIPPRHDSCSGAYPIGLGVPFSGSTMNAIGTADGPPSTCGGGLFRNVWHTFTPTMTAPYRIDTCGTNFDSLLTVFTTPDCSNFTQVACNDDSTMGTVAPCTPNANASRIESVSLNAGQTYYIRVGGYDSGSFGSYTLLVQLAPGVCCRGATCNASVPLAGCGPDGTAGARFVYTNGGCNPSGNTTTPCCYADYNKSGQITVADIFDFLNSWFAGSPFARVGSDGSPGPLAVQNIFDFLNLWFAGGC
jgi:hypothetical protein